MKTFTEYLYHANRVYEFRIKLADVDVTTENLARIKGALETYGVESMSKPKRLPIQEHQDFPKKGPCECHIIDISLKYPTTTEQLSHVIAERALLDRSCVCVKTKDGDEETTAAENLGKDHEGALLDDPELKAEDSQNLVGQSRVSGLLKELAKLSQKYEIAGKEKTSNETTNSLPLGKVSPVGSKQNKIPSPVKGK